MLYRLIISLLFVLSIASSNGNDRTLEFNEVGEAIVDVVVDKIESSCLFLDDKLMLKRLAYIQSEYGRKNNVTKYIGGIWRVTREQYDDVKRNIDPNKLEDVFRRFYVDINTSSYEDLNIPFYSGLFSMLYLERLVDLRRIESLPMRQAEQAIVFQEYIKPDSTLTDIELYKTKSDEMEPKCLQSKPVDIFILLDESGSIGANNFQMIKRFLANFSRNFDLGNDNTKSRISLSTFANRAKMSYSFTDRQTNQDFENHVLNIQYTKGRTNTADGLEMMIEQVAAHRRPASSGIPMVVLVITDGASNNKAKTIASAKKVHDQNLLVIALGLGNKKNLDVEELQNIASAPRCLHTFLLNSFDDLEYFTKILIREFSEAAHILSGTYGALNLKGDIYGNRPFNFQAVLSAAGTDIEVREEKCDQKIALYLSYKITKPNDVLFDTKTIINCTQPYKAKLYPISETKDRVYGSIKVIQNEKRSKRAAKIAPFEDEDGDLGSGDASYTPDCFPPSFSTKLPFTLIIKGNSPCPSGLFGEACDQKCKCRGGVGCDKETGECPNGACDYGYYGPGCQLKCPANTYSYLCSKKCRCRGRAQCDLETGECPNNECEVGWRGPDCQKFVCYDKIGHFHADRDFCDRFWYCPTNDVNIDGQLVTCPNGLYWEEGTPYCKKPNKLVRACFKGSSRWFAFPASTYRTDVELSPFARVQYDIYLLYKNINSNELQQKYFKLDDDDSSFIVYQTLTSQASINSSFYLQKIEQIWDYSNAYACPDSLRNLSSADLNDRFRQLTVRAQFTRENCSRGRSDMECLDSFNYGIYRHDPNSCSFYHKCEYENQQFVQSRLLMCTNAVFNQQKLKCITSHHYKFDQLRSTMPDEAKRIVCNEYLRTTYGSV